MDIYRPDQMDADQLGWFRPALHRLRTLGADPDPRLRSFLDPGAPLLLARAPGRLDVMGGIADYSGALVLQLPLALSTFALLQPRDEPWCEFATVRDGEPYWFRVELQRLVSGDLRDAEALAAWLAEREEGDRWAAYLLGVAHACLHRADAARSGAARGFRLLVHSEVPEGKGVSSSAALEVAGMAAMSAHFGVSLSPEALAAACQWAENRVVGAPCGIMDQMASACGRQHRLLRLRCQPGTIEGYVEVPSGYRFFGIDSGVRHAVSGADYGTVRAAAFMGYRMIAEAAGLPHEVRDGRVRVDDPRWGGYLANLTPAELQRRFRALLPERMEGGEFLSRFGGTTDSATRVDPARSYPVRAATEHPVHEQARVSRFARLLAELPLRPGAAEEMGALMHASHASYGACGLGSPETDRLVEMATRAGPERGLFGAKITGGGSGGTVALFGTADAEAEVRAIAAEYRRETGRGGQVFAASGPGAAETGVLVIEHFGRAIRNLSWSES